MTKEAQDERAGEAGAQEAPVSGDGKAPAGGGAAGGEGAAAPEGRAGGAVAEGHGDGVVTIDDQPASPGADKAGKGTDGESAKKEKGSSKAKGDKKADSGKKRKGAFSDAPPADAKGKAKESGGKQMGLMDSFLKGSSSSKKPKTEDAGSAKENLPPPKRLDMEVDEPKLRAGAEDADCARAPSEGEQAAAKEQPAALDEEDAMIVIDDKEEAASSGATAPSSTAAKPAEGGREKAVATVKPAAKAATAPKAPASSSASKKAKNAMPAEEREKKVKHLNEELALVAALHNIVHGDSIPLLRPDAEDDEVFDGVCTTDEVLTVKTRQAVARVIEGSSKSAHELGVWLQGCVAAHKRRAAAATEDAMEVDEEEGGGVDTEEAVRFQGVIERVGELVDGYFLKPDVTGGAESSEGDFVQVWSVKDIADIPVENRALVEAHRKMGASLRERAIHVRKMIFEIERSGKDLPKMDKALLAMKDKYGKLEDAGRKTKEKVEAKIETEKRKNQERSEKVRRKEEEARRKEEEEERAKQAKEAKMLEKLDKIAEKMEEQEEKKEKEREKKDKDKDKKKEVKSEKKHKKVEEDNSGKAKQASFMASFFVKKDTKSPSKPDAEGSSSKLAAPSERAQVSENKPHTNFHPWEKPANATVAAFPYGPGEPTEMIEEAPEPTIESWVARWKNLAPRPAPARPLREDGTPHKRMKYFAMHMRLPLVRTQLLDVDVDAMQKVVWDVEDNSEEQLAAIMEDAVRDEEGLYHWRGRMLQFALEGGGYFDCRRPPFFGTVSKASAAVTPRNPLGQEAELDYSYDSDCDWESEAGDAEDLGSDMGEDEDEEDEEDEGGFVVPDNEWGDEAPEGAVKKKVGKLTQIIFDAASMPPEMADVFAVRVLSDVPLVLANDKNVTFEENTDYEGCDVHTCKAPDMESVLYQLHKHPTACAFTWIPASAEHRFAGYVFLKNADAPGAKFCHEGMVSGYIKDVPDTKLAAIEAARLAEIAAEEKAKKDAAAAAQAAAWEELRRKAAAMRPPPEARKEKPMPEDSMTREQLVDMAKIVQGSPKGKPALADAVHTACKIAKTVASALLARVCHKKEQRWRLTGAFIEAKDLAEVAAEAWEVNSQEPLPVKKKAHEEADKEANKDGEEAAQGEEEAQGEGAAAPVSDAPPAGQDITADA